MLRTVLLAGSSWVGGTTPLAVLVAQAISGGADAPTPLTSLVFGALGSSPAPLILAWVVTRGDKEKAELRAAWAKEREENRVELAKERDENRRLNELRTDAAKEMATLLERTATTFAEIKSGMDVTLTKVRPDEMNRILRELKGLLADSHGEGHGP